MPLRRFSPYPFVVFFFALVLLDYLGFVSIFRRNVSLKEGFNQVWIKKSAEFFAADVLPEEVEKNDPTHLREQMQLKLFEDAEEWCSVTNYTGIAMALPSAEELADLHRKEDVWDELQTMALIITSNFPWKPVIGLLQRLYQPYFKITIFCGTFYSNLFMSSEDYPEIISPFNYINISEKEMHEGFFAYYCLVKAKELHLYDVDGYFVMSDDTTFNFWHTLPLRQVFHPTGITYSEYTGMWWPTNFGKAAVVRALELITGKYKNKKNVQNMFRKYQNGLAKNGFLQSAYVQLTAVDGWSMSDLYYVPTDELEYFSQLMKIFYEAEVFHEIAISKFLHAVSHKKLEMAEVVYLWEPDRDKWADHYTEKMVMIHPIKFSQFKDYHHREKFCNTVVLTFKKALFNVK